MTNEERVASLHNKMIERKKKKDKILTCCIGTVNMGLFIFLIAIIKQSGFVFSGFSGEYTGAMLFENVGGYVLLALVAFMLGVGVSVMCIYLSKRNKQLPGAGDRSEKDDSDE